MIKVFGRLLCVPENEKILGYVADNLVEERQFKITDPSLFSFSFKLELENGSVKDIIDLPHTMEDGALVLTWNITASCLRFAGPLYAQLRAFSNSDMVWHSEIAEFSVCRSIAAEGALPPLLPSEFAEMEKRMTSLKSATESASLSAASAAEEASTYLETVSESANKASQNAEDAASSATDAAQVLATVEAVEKRVETNVSIANSAAISANAACEGASLHADTASAAATEASRQAAFIQETLGDMDAVLDSILSLQASYIGGDAA